MGLFPTGAWNGLRGRSISEKNCRDKYLRSVSEKKVNSAKKNQLWNFRLIQEKTQILEIDFYDALSGSVSEKKVNSGKKNQFWNFQSVLEFSVSSNHMGGIDIFFQIRHFFPEFSFFPRI